jgi:hypothetical protein
MRKLRELKQGVWYEIRTRVNNREPLFRRWKVIRAVNRIEKSVIKAGFSAIFAGYSEMQFVMTFHIV